MMWLLPVLALGADYGAGQQGAAPSEYANGLLLIRSGNLTQARSELEAVTRQGCKPMPLYLLGYVHAHQGRPKETIKTLSRALECAPSLSQPYRGDSVRLIRWAALQLGDEREHVHYTLSVDEPAKHDTFAMRTEQNDIRNLTQMAKKWVPGIEQQQRLRQATQARPLTPEQAHCAIEADDPSCASFGSDEVLPSTALPADDAHAEP